MHFSAEILAAGRGGHAVVVPRPVAASFPERRPRVVATVGDQSCSARLAVYGGTTYLGLRKDFLGRIGASAGDAIEIELTADPEADHGAQNQAPQHLTEPAGVDPAEVAKLLVDQPEGLAAYRSLVPEHQREYARWITTAATEPERRERLDRMLRRLADR